MAGLQDAVGRLTADPRVSATSINHVIGQRTNFCIANAMPSTPRRRVRSPSAGADEGRRRIVRDLFNPSLGSTPPGVREYARLRVTAPTDRPAPPTCRSQFAYMLLKNAQDAD